MTPCWVDPLASRYQLLSSYSLCCVSFGQSYEFLRSKAPGEQIKLNKFKGSSRRVQSKLFGQLYVGVHDSSDFKLVTVSLRCMDASVGGALCVGLHICS